MERLLTFFLIICAGGTYVSAQSGRNRPRVVPSPTPANPQTYPDTEPIQRNPPTLGGAVRGQEQGATQGDDERAAGDDSEVIRVETNLVTFPVSVLARDGSFVTGLTKQDFRILEDGVQQEIQHFQPVETPFTIVLVIDVSPSTRFKIDEIRDAAMGFIRQLRDDDKVMIVAFDEKIEVLSPPTNDRWALQSALRQLDFGSGTSLYQTVDRLIKRELRRIEGRKAVVLFTDGVDTTSRGASYQSTLRDVAETDAVFFPVRYDTFADMGGYGGGTQRGGGYPTGRRGGSGSAIGTIIGIILSGSTQGGGQTSGRSQGSTRAEYETGRRYLDELAAASGGRTYDGSTDLGAAFTGIAEELRRQYSIGYYPEKPGQPGEVRQLRVRVMRPNLVVKAKTSYIVGDR